MDAGHDRRCGMRLRRRKPANDGFVRLLRVRNGAVLAERRDGSVVCAHCPFACLAAYEPCEFDGECIADRGATDGR